MSDQSGFIEPPPWLPAKPESPPEADESSHADPITLPPTVADSATHRLPAERQRPEKPEIVFFQAPPGAAPVAPAAEPEIADATVHVSRPARSWRLVLEGLPPVVVGSVLFLGRNPSPTPGHEGSPVFAIPDTTKSVSKTHAMLEVDAQGLWVHDLNSTNGVWVVAEGSDPVEVVPGRKIAVPPGSDLELGDVVIQVERT